jgi:hypothetical protein
MPKVINTQIRRNNSNNTTYVVKKFDNGTYVFNTYQLVKGCYYLVKRQKGVCVV